MILNVFVTQAFKRFIYRKRPGQQMPPRSEQLFRSQSSSFPSRTVVSATTITFIALTSNNWSLSLEFLNGQSFELVLLFTALTYVVMSLARIYLGASFPTDCVFSLGPIAIILALHYFLSFLTDSIDFCPTCDVRNFCYVQSDPAIYQVITRSTFDFWALNGGYGLTLILAALAVFTTITIKPVELWSKTPYFFGSCLAILLFQTTMLCPHAGNGYATLPSPAAMALSKDPFQSWIVISLLLFSFGVTFLVNTLLGQRTGPALSYLLRAVFCGTITFMTFISLVTVRLLIVSQYISL